MSKNNERTEAQSDSDHHVWICVLVDYRYMITKGIDQLADLFVEMMGDDYITHRLLDPGEEPADDTASCYVLLCCRDYRPHVSKFIVCPYLRGVLNSYKNIHELSPDEVGAVRKTPSNVVNDGGHVTNRTGFFMIGDIVRVKSNTLGRIQGIVIARADDNTYSVFFRLFTRSFTQLVDVDDLDFVTSLFRFYKFPVSRRGLTPSKKLVTRVVTTYRAMLSKQVNEQLVADDKTKHQ